MANILFVYANKSSFVEVDIDILREKHTVIERKVTKQIMFNLIGWIHDVRKADLIVAWFASWHALPAYLLAFVFRKPRLLFTSGYDIANEPDIHYGLRQGDIRTVISDIVFRLVTIAIVPSQFSFDEAVNNTPLEPHQISLIPHAVEDRNAFRKMVSKRPIVITVGAINESNLKRKGIQYFLEAAKYLPDIMFYAVGGIQPELLAQLEMQVSENVVFTGYLSDEDLWKLMAEASVYVQASHHEGFGVSVAEAMLARCIPVVSRHGALPEVVGENGLYIDSFAGQALANSITFALSKDDMMGSKARDSIIERFGLDQRRQALQSSIESLLAE